MIETVQTMDAMPLVPGVTKRQVEVLSLLSDGMTFKEIGAMLGISWKTVDTHVSDCRLRLGARNTAHAVRLAIERGLIHNGCK